MNAVTAASAGTAELTVVGIGASAGGLDAFHLFFGNLPAKTGMAYVVLLHLPADRPSLLPEILARWTPMRVSPARDGQELEADTVYVPPPHASVVLRDQKLQIIPAEPGSPRERRPIDGFFDTLSALGPRAVGIVLSGNGSDGALGLKAIRESGGLTMAQGVDADTGLGEGPQYAAMPTAAVATGTVDLVAPAEDLPRHLLRLRGVRLDEAPPGETEAEQDDLRRAICVELRTAVGHDFSGYKAKTFMRRVHRRMQVVDAPNLQAYLERLRADHQEAKLLFRDLLIRVTSFFRDADAFEVIERVVMPRLFQGKHADGTVRIWVPGCATGEEAYSLAILLRERMDAMNAPPKVQIFGTDIDGPAIDTARLGRYPAVLLDGLSPERRERFFHRSDSGYIVSRDIRELCTFSPHSLVRDPPFSRMDLVSCRNLLIYLDADVQSAVLPSFHYSLSPGGILILGISESTARHTELFETIDKPARIFQRRDVRAPPLPLAGRKLQQILHPERTMQPVTRQGSPMPAIGKAEGQPAAQSPGVPARPSRLRRFTAAAARRFYPETVEAEALRTRLAEREAELQSLTEEHLTAVEELRSSNEELHSVNEELQSANEELETSKEEIQSVNEELHTLNAQLSEKLDELDRANSDLKNLLDSTQIATVFLDLHLIIRGFTPAITSLYRLIPSDVGRPLTDIASKLDYATLREDAARVLETLAPVERHLSHADGQVHYIMRMLPYRAPDSSVSGTLMTFLDVTEVVQAEKHQRLLVDELNHRVKNMLTVVISMASQTMRRSKGLEEFGEAFMGRVHALSASYTLLSRENWMSISLRDVIEEELKPFTERGPGSGAGNVHLDGSEVQLAPTGALALGMAIHELATNAVKYGALSRPDGSISVGWRCVDDEGQDALEIVWQEEGGPEVQAPRQRGFGTLLIERSFSHELSGSAALDFAASGLQAVLRAPWSRVVRGAGDAAKFADGADHGQNGHG